MNNKRQVANELEMSKRKNTFEEVRDVFSDEQALQEASRCLNCKKAICVEGCPVNVDIPGFITLIKQGKTAEAYKKIKETNNLPAVCGRVCPQETQCEGKCIRGIKGESVAIGSLERYCADFGLKNNIKTSDVNKKTTNKKVAVIGSGPAGLTAAADLAAYGVDVTVFEAFHTLGGVLVYGIPEFRLPKAIVEEEINKLKEQGVKFRLNTVAGKTVLLEELQTQYDAIFIGTGAGLPMFLNIEGEGLNGVMSANEFLTRINLMKAFSPDSRTPVRIGNDVAVVGAGNVAMDAARTAVRLGSKTVKIVYRRSAEEVPARHEEFLHAVEEGVECNFLTNPVRIIGENGMVTGMECVRMELGEPDASGRRRPVEIKGSNFILPCDTVIVSLGTSPSPILTGVSHGLKTSKWGTIEVDPSTNQTSLQNVYAGGDAVTGAATVILAMGAGKKAAAAILEKFGLK